MHEMRKISPAGYNKMLMSRCSKSLAHLAVLHHNLTSSTVQFHGKQRTLVQWGIGDSEECLTDYEI